MAKGRQAGDEKERSPAKERAIQAQLNDFAVRSFRNVADQDYIAARTSYRAGLIPQFLWSSLQAFEKYLKAILLFNRIPARSVGHSLSRALDRAKGLPFELGLSDDTHYFMNFVDKFGEVRYLERSYYVRGPEFILLDKAVWEIRRYCKVLDYSITLDGGRVKRLLDFELRMIQGSEDRPPQEFRWFRGHLEKVTAKKAHPSRPFLIWQNAYFGSRRRRTVEVPTHFHATNAPLALTPALVDEVKKYVHLPRALLRAAGQKVETDGSAL